jgi:hypothetical protein
VILAVIRDQPQHLGEEHQVFLLSPVDSRQTLFLDHEIVNAARTKSGRPFAWTLGHRYASEAALLGGATTTADLDRLDH